MFLKEVAGYADPESERDETDAKTTITCLNMMMFANSQLQQHSDVLPKCKKSIMILFFFCIIFF